MARRSIVAVVAATACVLSVVSAPGVQAKAKPLRAKADAYSLNWAGYYVLAKPGQRVTEVSGSTFAPKLKLLPPTQAASWVGIGGAMGSDLIQAGVAFGQVDGYYAWFERLPEPIQRISSGCVGDATCKVSQGDRIDMNIRHLGGNLWRMSLANAGKWTWSMDTAYDSSFSSAEWIYEAPSYSFLGLPVGVYTTPANIAHARFLTNRYVLNGQGKVLKQGDATRTHFSPVGVPKISTPSNVKANGDFAVCPYKQTCKTP